MKKLILTIALIASMSLNAQAAELKVQIDGIESDSPIPEKFAHCVARPDNKSADGENISPAISWSKAPEGTKSFALIVVDRDVPLNFDNASKEGKTIEQYAPRQNFYHWILMNMPTTSPVARTYGAILCMISSPEMSLLILKRSLNA